MKPSGKYFVRAVSSLHLDCEHSRLIIPSNSFQPSLLDLMSSIFIGFLDYLYIVAHK